MIETERLLLAPLDVSRLEEFVVMGGRSGGDAVLGPGGPFSREVAERSFAASLARVEEHGFGRRWIVNKERGARALGI